MKILFLFFHKYLPKIFIFSLKPYKKSGPGGGPNSSSNDRNGGGATLTPSSSTLVINSLAYQILPGQGVIKQQSDSNDLGSAGYSSPSSTTSRYYRVEGMALFGLK